jgi:hypothetical protein
MEPCKGAADFGRHVEGERTGAQGKQARGDGGRSLRHDPIPATVGSKTIGTMREV